MGDYLYNAETGPWACVSVRQAAWPTDGQTEAHLLSLSLHYILSFCGRAAFSRRTVCMLSFLWPSDGVEYSLNLFLFSCKDLLFLLLGFFFVCVITRLGFLHSSVRINLSCCLWSSTSPIPLCRLPVCGFLGDALLTHCDSSALWTPCLPTDDHMLPQHRSGKLSLYPVNFTTLVCSSQAGNLQTFKMSQNQNNDSLMDTDIGVTGWGITTKERNTSNRVKDVSLLLIKCDRTRYFCSVGSLAAAGCSITRRLVLCPWHTITVSEHLVFSTSSPLSSAYF